MMSRAGEWRIAEALVTSAFGANFDQSSIID